MLVLGSAQVALNFPLESGYNVTRDYEQESEWWEVDVLRLACRMFETLSILLEKSYFSRGSTNCFVVALLYPRGT